MIKRYSVTYVLPYNRITLYNIDTKQTSSQGLNKVIGNIDLRNFSIFNDNLTQLYKKINASNILAAFVIVLGDQLEFEYISTALASARDRTQNVVLISGLYARLIHAVNMCGFDVLRPPAKVVVVSSLDRKVNHCVLEWSEEKYRLVSGQFPTSTSVDRLYTTIRAVRPQFIIVQIIKSTQKSLDTINIGRLKRSFQIPVEVLEERLVYDILSSGGQYKQHCILKKTVSDSTPVIDIHDFSSQFSISRRAETGYIKNTFIALGTPLPTTNEIPDHADELTTLYTVYDGTPPFMASHSLDVVPFVTSPHVVEYRKMHISTLGYITFEKSSQRSKKVDSIRKKVALKSVNKLMRIESPKPSSSAPPSVTDDDEDESISVAECSLDLDRSSWTADLVMEFIDDRACIYQRRVDFYDLVYVPDNYAMVPVAAGVKPPASVVLGFDALAKQGERGWTVVSDIVHLLASNPSSPNFERDQQLLMIFVKCFLKVVDFRFTPVKSIDFRLPFDLPAQSRPTIEKVFTSDDLVPHVTLTVSYPTKLQTLGA